MDQSQITNTGISFEAGADADSVMNDFLYCAPHCEGAKKFCRDLATQGKKVRLGMDASGHARLVRATLGGTEHRAILRQLP